MAASMVLSSRVSVQAPSQSKLSFTASCKPLRTVAPIKPHQVARIVNCSAEPKQNVGSILTAAALAVAVGISSVDNAYADISGLTPCSESAGFAKRQKNELRGLSKRLALYEEGSAPALALTATIERTNARFANYGKSGVLCGTDGLPHLIADPGLALRYGHAGEIFIPTIGFLYIAGYIGYVGRAYLNAVKSDKKPTDKEIIIDVPLAIELSLKGAGWPLAAISELRNGTLFEAEENITVSPR